MTSCSAAPAARRRALPRKASSMLSLTVGMKVTVIFGNSAFLICHGFQIAQRRALRALDAHRHDPGVALVGDHRRALVDLHDAAGDGETPLREDHQRRARLDERDQMFGRERRGRIDLEGA